MQTILVNHVMSRDIESGIFDAIIGYFRECSPPWVQHAVSLAPMPDAQVFHYHRPHLELRLLPNSVCTVHHDLTDPDPWHALSRFLPRYREAGAVVCLNSTQREILQNEGIPAAKLFVAPHGYNDRLLSPKRPSATRKPHVTLGVVSRRYGRRVKGEAYLLELAKRLDPNFFRFLLVGQDRGIDAVPLRHLGFATRVFERMPYRLFQEVYEEMDALLMCSSHEGGPANIPEALGTGTPVFCSPVGMTPDLVVDGENGLFLSMDPDRDAQRIRQVCQFEPQVFDEIRRASILGASTTPTWLSSVEKNLHVYGQILSQDVFQEPPAIPVGTAYEESIFEEAAA